MDRNVLAKRVKEIRNGLGVTQVEFARRIGCHQTMISKLENAVNKGVGVEILEGIADLGGCSLDYLRGSDREEVSDAQVLAQPVLPIWAVLYLKERSGQATPEEQERLFQLAVQDIAQSSAVADVNGMLRSCYHPESDTEVLLLPDEAARLQRLEAEFMGLPAKIPA